MRRPHGSLQRSNANPRTRRLVFKGVWGTGIPHSPENATPWDLTVGLWLGPYGGPRGGAVSFERGTPKHIP